ncbi:hypothetical protein D3C87_1194760 [compost metagenome]
MSDRKVTIAHWNIIPTRTYTAHICIVVPVENMQIDVAVKTLSNPKGTWNFAESTSSYKGFHLIHVFICRIFPYLGARCAVHETHLRPKKHLITWLGFLMLKNHSDF